MDREIFITLNPSPAASNSTGNRPHTGQVYRTGVGAGGGAGGAANQYEYYRDKLLTFKVKIK